MLLTSAWTRQLILMNHFESVVSIRPTRRVSLLTKSPAGFAGQPPYLEPGDGSPADRRNGQAQLGAAAHRRGLGTISRHRYCDHNETVANIACAIRVSRSLLRASRTAW